MEKLTIKTRDERCKMHQMSFADMNVKEIYLKQIKHTLTVNQPRVL